MAKRHHHKEMKHGHKEHAHEYMGRHHSDGRHMSEMHGHDGHHGMKHAGHARLRPDTEHYSGMDSRRREEMRDAGMIHEDHNAIANLPQGVIMREYPKVHDYLDWSSDDTAGGIAKQMDLDHGKMRMNFNPKKV